MERTKKNKYTRWSVLDFFCVPTAEIVHKMVNKTTIFAKKERRNFSPCQLRIRDFVPTRARTHFSNRLKLWILNSLMPEPELSFLAHSPRSVFEVVQAGNHFVQNGIK
ncbi:hypothetical protein TWF569_000725 [Orbilia oligospora]|uniref:Uncharacterized protein n=1 Tax=Orbilia oligospora TaxID=2813651 RepID=A0A7C8NFU6_ORBOL|nr:hypothetical protein TWF706_001556 [Orbilia oligospora]KAF3082745.1 hypothetical protein TWF706_001556 [Orbilia oligospora]KAF3086018.1 hypothetical protein TWF103_001892 [Orbilia oligospora]KAF3086019.1 hypothetical protein TWF103_001892 [Orbilia oligospora]KAF3097793.1 hypothetical protein TWF102_006300 [Orbilia oligospora]